ncbi:hypothetical protein A2774_00575 [Candidatus Roizmanbacteria bacterium RIFCSPHIGHO2_01_FULL_39_12c]|uniref:Curlin n=1 Tax=Candidatus Roizmanbacteria bacterium RIFCSPHIGHO2_01_FULL_39_12c TaxID=1802031 RepID=A0A1F7GAE5_9BACT|nr:MAG: hypothetical protein A2774_00575 [Candidatus Roizmanbacteria bacterium RIFCSPHIGHO2_01_FULL_39_12c]OGK47365.1 MAG: hypothetical protein A2963_04495 [Candidatus Roizmanbacteria bacterium RIFCSPLOWO2_01_FULL_40_13]
MVKKLIAGGAAAALALSLVAGVLASNNGENGDYHRRGHSGTTNVAVVYGNNAGAVANTGKNWQVGLGTSGELEQEMETGDAEATAGQDIIVNSSTCGCDRRGRGKNFNFGLVGGNNALALANTGHNVQIGVLGGHHQGQNGGGLDVEGNGDGSRHGRGGELEQELETGDADAYAWQTIVVNSSVGESDEE